MNPMQRAASQWRDRRLVKKYGTAAKMMNGVDHTEAYLSDMARKANTPEKKEFAATMYRTAAASISNVDRKTSRRADKLNRKPELRSRVDKKLGLKTPEETRAELGNLF